MLIAEELVLLALDTEGAPARGHSNQPAAAVGVTGALVAELALDGHLTLDDDRIRFTGTVPEDPMLAQALENARPHEGKKLKSRLSSIKHSGWSEVVDRMIDRGILGHEKELLRPTLHPVLDVVAHAEVLDRMRRAATSDVPIDERTAVLLALSGPCQLLEVVAPERADRKEAKRRIAEAAERVPAAAAVKRIVDATQTAVAAGVIAAVASSN